MVKRTVLQNGLRVLTVPMQNTRAVTVTVLVGTGSKYEERRTNGISHFLEHMFFKGTTARPTPFDIASPIENKGGVFNASTTQSATWYDIKIDREHLHLALSMVADIFSDSLFPVEEIEKEKGVILEEIYMRKDTPSICAFDLFEKFLYGDQPAGWDTAGTKESVEGITRDDLLSYMRSQYVAKNTVVCVAGDIQEHDVIKNVEVLFENIPANNFKQRPPVTISQQKPEVLIEYRETDQTQLALGFRASNVFQEEQFAEDLLASILGSGMSSRLFTRVREKLGLAYDIFARTESDQDNGYLLCSAGLKKGREEEAIEAIMEELRDIKESGVSEQELKNSKERRKGRLALWLESSDANSIFYGMQEILENHFYTPEELCGKIDGVTLEDIHEAAQRMFVPEKLNMVVLGPHKDKEKFEKLLII